MDSRVRAVPEQLSTLLEYMETHGDLSRPLGGPQGRLRSDRLWLELANMLNAVGGGVNKTTEKWKKVWADWKSKTKKKGLAIRRHTGGSGGGSASRHTLSPMEERLLAVMGVLAVEGQASIEELGFNRSESFAQEVVVTVDDTEYLETVDEPSTSQSSNDWLLSLSTSQSQTPPFRPLTRIPQSSQGQQPAAPSPPTPPVPSSPPTPPPPPVSPSPPASRTAAPRTPTPPCAKCRGRPRSPGRPRLRARRWRQATTPFDRAAAELAAVESRRLAAEETRTRLQHERDLRALALQHERDLRALALQHERDLRALEIDHERNEVLRTIVNIAQAWLDYYRSRDNTEPQNIE